MDWTGLGRCGKKGTLTCSSLVCFSLVCRSWGSGALRDVCGWDGMYSGDVENPKVASDLHTYDQRVPGVEGGVRGFYRA